MNALPNSKIQHAEKARRLARYSTLNTEEELFQTPGGGFYLRITETYFRGRRLGPFEGWRDLGITRLPDERLQSDTRVRPLSKRSALEWCIKTQIPETLRGYLLDCI
ncbi:MAG: hypothetical protein ACYDH9_14595 [Limisphaerales bacterium]